MGNRDDLEQSDNDPSEAESGLAKESDGTLLYYMSCQGGQADLALCNAAAEEFHRRHFGALLARCERHCRRIGGPSGFDQDLAQATFARAVERADRFTEIPGTTYDPRRTQSWLGTIARNLLVDSLRNPHRPGPITGTKDEVPSEDYSDEELAAMLCDGKALARDRETIRLVKEAFSTLPERVRVVLTQTVLQRMASPKASYMYRGSAAALAKRLDTTPENVRRIRKNGLKELAIYVKAHRQRRE